MVVNLEYGPDGMPLNRTAIILVWFRRDYIATYESYSTIFSVVDINAIMDSVRESVVKDVRYVSNYNRPNTYPLLAKIIVLNSEKESLVGIEHVFSINFPGQESLSELDV